MLNDLVIKCGMPGVTPIACVEANGRRFVACTVDGGGFATWEMDVEGNTFHGHYGITMRQNAEIDMLCRAGAVTNALTLDQQVQEHSRKLSEAINDIYSIAIVPRDERSEKLEEAVSKIEYVIQDMGTE